MTFRTEDLAEGKVTLCSGDCLDVLQTLDANSIDSCVTDPPYGLGFMGKAWDHGVPGVRYWKAVYRVLKPGAHLLAFGGTRTFGRMHVAIEDAGFEIRDMISWLYGSGFPKSLDVSKAIDRAAGVDGSFGDPKSAAHAELIAKQTAMRGEKHEGWSRPWMSDPDAIERTNRQYLPGSEQGQQWSGFGTALKPACEPIVLARKPLEGTVAQNVLKWGVGALNIDGCRVATDPNVDDPRLGGAGAWTTTQAQSGDTVSLPRGTVASSTLGRWPANVILSDDPEVQGAFPDAPGQQRYVGPEHGDRPSRGIYGDFGAPPPHEPRDNGGSAARFFYQVKKDTLCGLCDLPYQPETDSVFSCSANSVALRLSTGSILTGASALTDVVVSPAPVNVDSGHQSNGHATNAGSRSPQCHPQKVDCAQKNAPTELYLRTVQNVMNAARLCGLCATAIAHALVEVRRSGCAAPVHFNPSIGLSKEAILSRSLASYVAHRESTDTILTTTNLRELFGCVFYAIGESIRSERAGSEANTGLASKRLFYSSKADSDDRLGSKHPTVKPVSLIRYLARLITPPGGLILDPFAGTGTLGEAALYEGFRAILIEREAEYQEDIRRRMRLAMCGPSEREREAIKAKMKDKPIDAGPLFGGTAEAIGGGRMIYNVFADEKSGR